MDSPSKPASVVSTTKRGRGRPPLSDEEKAKRAAIKATEKAEKETSRAATKAAKEAAKEAEKAAKDASRAATKAAKEAAKAAAPKRSVGRPPKAGAGAGTASVMSYASTESIPKPALDTALPDDPVAANKALNAELSALRRRYAALETVYQKEHAALTAIRTTVAGC